MTAESTLKNLIVIPPMERRQTPDLSTVIMQIGQMQADIGGMKDAVKEMSAAITRLAVIEERMVQSNQQHDRAFQMIRDLQCEMRKVEERAEVLEKAMPVKDLVQKGVLGGVWAILGAVALFIAKKVGLL